MGATAFWEQRVGDYLIRGGTAAVISTWYIGLVGADDVECAGGNYARIQYNPTSGNWAAYPSYSNAAEITWPQPNTDWHASGSASKVAIYDASSGGNQLYLESLTTAKAVTNGAPPVYFPIGNLTLVVT